MLWHHQIYVTHGVHVDGTEPQRGDARCCDPDVTESCGGTSLTVSMNRLVKAFRATISYNVSSRRLNCAGSSAPPRRRPGAQPMYIDKKLMNQK